jgi:RecA/RadA recombinase
VASETSRADNAEQQLHAAQALAATETTRANTTEERKVTLLNVDVVHALVFMRHGAIGRG